MEGEGEGQNKSQRLSALAEKLRFYGSSPRSQRFQTSTETQLGGPPRAAVLVCAFEGMDGDLRVLLTKRSSKLSSHPGEVAFPGGKRDESDAGDVETALREAQEEIGLDPCLVDVVTVLQPFYTKRGIIVVPVVGILYDREAFCPALNPNEVESMFDVPLEMFLKKEGWRAEEREWMDESYLLHYFDYQSETEQYVIWALTAAILILVASVVYGRPPEFEERRPRFWDRLLNGELPKR